MSTVGRDGDDDDGVMVSSSSSPLESSSSHSSSISLKANSPSYSSQVSSRVGLFLTLTPYRDLTWFLCCIDIVDEGIEVVHRRARMVLGEPFPA
jgi:hypothetical protein